MLHPSQRWRFCGFGLFERFRRGTDPVSRQCDGAVACDYARRLTRCDTSQLVSPAYLLRLVAAQGQSSTGKSPTVGSLYDAAIDKRAIAPDTPMRAFMQSLLLLEPVALKITPVNTSELQTDGLRQSSWRTPEEVLTRAQHVSLQPWIDGNHVRYSIEGRREPPNSPACSRKLELCKTLFQLVPTFYVAVAWVQNVKQQTQYHRHLTHLSWAELTAQDAELEFPFLQWTADKRAVRLAPWHVCLSAIRLCGLSGLSEDREEERRHGYGSADGKYALLPLHSAGYHEAVRLLCGLVPSFYVPTADPLLRARFQQLTEVVPTVSERFPTPETLLFRPDMQAMLETSERALLTPMTAAAATSVSSAALVVRLHRSFAHPLRGAADRFFSSGRVPPNAWPTLAGQKSVEHTSVTVVPPAQCADALRSIAEKLSAKDPAAKSVLAVHVGCHDEAADAVKLALAVCDVSAAHRSVQVLPFQVNASSDEAAAALPTEAVHMLRDKAIVKVVTTEAVGMPGRLTAFHQSLTRSSASTSTGSLTELCQFLGAAVGEADLAHPHLAELVCRRAGLAVTTAVSDYGPASLTAECAAAAQTALAAAVLLSAGTQGQSVQDWQAFLSLSPVQQKDHEYTLRLRQYHSFSSADGADSATPIARAVSAHDGVSALDVASKRATLAELVLQYGPERTPQLCSPANVTPAQATVSAAAMAESANEMCVEPEPQQLAAAEAADGGSGEPLSNTNGLTGADEGADFDSLEALLEEASRLPDSRRVGAHEHHRSNTENGTEREATNAGALNEPRRTDESADAVPTTPSRDAFAAATQSAAAVRDNNATAEAGDSDSEDATDALLSQLVAPSSADDAGLSSPEPARTRSRTNHRCASTPPSMAVTPRALPTPDDDWQLPPPFVPGPVAPRRQPLSEHGDVLTDRGASRLPRADSGASRRNAAAGGVSRNTGAWQQPPPYRPRQARGEQVPGRLRSDSQRNLRPAHSSPFALGMADAQREEDGSGSTAAGPWAPQNRTSLVPSTEGTSWDGDTARTLITDIVQATSGARRSPPRTPSSAERKQSAITHGSHLPSLKVDDLRTLLHSEAGRALLKELLQ